MMCSERKDGQGQAGGTCFTDANTLSQVHRLQKRHPGVPVLQSLQPSPASQGAAAGSREGATAVFGGNYLKSYECSPKY